MTSPESPDLEALLTTAEQEALSAHAAEAARRAEAAALRCATVLADAVKRSPNADIDHLPAELAEQLRLCVAEYALALRMTNMPPEVAVVRIKRLIKDSVAQSGAEADLLTQSAVTWAIEGYYGP